MRLFVALDIEDETRNRIVKFIDGVRAFAPEARWVRPESLHITLKFIGEGSGELVEEMRAALTTVKLRPFEIKFRHYGFFPNAKAARVFWVGIEAGQELRDLATAVDSTLARLGIEPDKHPYSPHLTIARGGGRSGAPGRQKADRPNRDFDKLQEKLAALPAPEFGTITCHEFFLYQSHLSSGGSRYEKLARFKLDQL